MSHQTFLSDTGIPSLPTEWLVLFFVFAAVYGILTTVGRQRGGSGLFGNPAINALIGLVFAFFAAGNPAFVAFFETNFITLVWLFIGLFVLAFLLEAFGLRGLPAREKAKEHAHMTIILGGLILLVLVSFGFGLLSDFEVPFIGTKNAIMLLGLLFIFQMFYYAYMGGGKK